MLLLMKMVDNFYIFDGIFNWTSTVNNLQNLGIYQVVKEGLKDLNIIFIS